MFFKRKKVQFFGRHCLRIREKDVFYEKFYFMRFCLNDRINPVFMRMSGTCENIRNNEGVLPGTIYKETRLKASKMKKGGKTMAVTVKDLLEAGCHFGHQTKRWNPKMKEFVYGSKNGISIIDLTKTIRQISDVCNFLQREVMNGSKILFVGTKRQAQQIVRETAEATGMYYISERWMGGTLTNIETIRKSVRKMHEIDEVINSESQGGLKKKEVALMARAGEKLHKNLDGIKDMKHLPDVVVVIDVCHDAIAVKEAVKLKIPVVAIVDTNGDPSNIDYPIAANDDAVKSIKVIIDTCVEAIKDASELYQAKVAEEKAKEEAEKAKKAAEEKTKRPAAAKGEKSFTKRPAAKRPAAKKKADKEEVKAEAEAEVKPAETVAE